MMRAALVLTVALLSLIPGLIRADVQMTRITDLLYLRDYLAISRREGLDDSMNVAAEMLGHPPGAMLRGQIDHIHDGPRLLESLRQTMQQALPEQHRDKVLNFLGSALGQRIMEVELTARRAFSDPDIETAATAAWLQAEETPDQQPVLDRIDELSQILDLTERNIAGALNAQFQFYRGLSDGGAMKMDEQDMLAEVWSQEPDLRTETENWLGGYLFMAYAPLSSQDMQGYIDFSRSPAGQALNAALFQAFNAMYDEQSYLLGRLIALNMTAQDI